MNISRSHFFTLVANLYFISYSTPHVVRIMVWILTFGVFDISHVSCEVFFLHHIAGIICCMHTVLHLSV